MATAKSKANRVVAGAISTKTPAQELAARIPDSVERILEAHARRLREAYAIVEMCSDLMVAAGGNPDAKDSEQITAALYGALRLLKPVSEEIDDKVALAQAALRAEADEGLEVVHG